MDELLEYLKNNKDKSCEKTEPVDVSENYIPVKPTQIHRLDEEAVKTYLIEQTKN